MPRDQIEAHCRAYEEAIAAAGPGDVDVVANYTSFQTIATRLGRGKKAPPPVLPQ